MSEHILIDIITNKQIIKLHKGNIQDNIIKKLESSLRDKVRILSDPG